VFKPGGMDGIHGTHGGTKGLPFTLPCYRQAVGSESLPLSSNASLGYLEINMFLALVG